MSTSLHWRPVPKEKKDSYLGYQLKFHIAEKLWGHDGSLNSEWEEVDSDWIPFLEGIASAGEKELAGEAEKLIELIKKHGAVQLSLIG